MHFKRHLLLNQVGGLRHIVQGTVSVELKSVALTTQVCVFRLEDLDICFMLFPPIKDKTFEPSVKQDGSLVTTLSSTAPAVLSGPT